MTTNEISALSSHAVLISEIAELRRQLWQVISAGKKVVAKLESKDQMVLLDALIEAERKLH